MITTSKAGPKENVRVDLADTFYRIALADFRR